MDVLVLKLEDGTIFQHRRKDNIYEGLDLNKIVAHHAAIVGKQPQSVVDSAIVAEEVVAGFSSTEIDVANGKVTTDSLARAKREGIARTDKKTSAAISKGFVYEGKTFSLSMAAQSSLNGVWAMRDDPTIFPLTWTTIDNLDSISLDADTFEAFYATAFAKIRKERDVGAKVKAAIRAATSVAQVHHILAEDNR